MKAKTLYKKLIRAHSNYDAAISAIEKELDDKVEFSFSVFYQEADGFVILHNEEAKNAPLSLCMMEIQKHGTLSYERYLKHSI